MKSTLFIDYRICYVHQVMRLKENLAEYETLGLNFLLMIPKKLTSNFRMAKLSHY